MFASLLVGYCSRGVLLDHCCCSSLELVVRMFRLRGFGGAPTAHPEVPASSITVLCVFPQLLKLLVRIGSDAEPLDAACQIFRVSGA